MKNLKISKSYTGRDNISLGIYFQDIGKTNAVSPEEEEKLAKRIKEGDPIALEKLIRANLRFVVSVAKQYQHRGLSLSDLISEGNIGLIKAARRFDETRGFKFISYAVWWIRQSIIQALNNHARTIRVPLNKLRISASIKKASSAFEQDHQREPGIDELAEELRVSRYEIAETLVCTDRTCSLDEPLASNPENAVLLDVLEDMDAPGSDSSLMKESSRAMLEEALSILQPRESSILKQYYGLDTRLGVSLEQISSQTNLSRERVRRLKQRALKKLKGSGLDGLFQAAFETVS